MADARVIGNDDAGALGQSRIIAQRGGRKNSGVRTGCVVGFLLTHGGKDNGFDAHVAERLTEFVEVFPLLFFAVMQAAGNRSEQCEVFGNAVFGHQVACGGLVARKQSHAEFFRNGIPGRGAAPGLDRSVGKTEKPLHFMHGAGFFNDFVQQKAAAIRRKARVAYAPDGEKQGRTEGIRKKQPQRTRTEMIADVADSVQILGDVPLNGVEPPAHAGHQVLRPTLARQHGCEAASLQKAKGGESHAAVADMIGQTAENVRHLRKTRIEKIQ